MADNPSPTPTCAPVTTPTPSSSPASTPASSPTCLTKEKSRSQTPSRPRGEFLRARHVKFFTMHLKLLPSFYAAMDNSRMTLMYFSLSALDVMKELDNVVSDTEKKQMIDWIYAMQVTPTQKGDTSRCGFRGSPYTGISFEPSCEHCSDFIMNPADESHIAMTYTALCNLQILGDDFSRVKKDAIISSLKHLQKRMGNFAPNARGGEADMRFLFCGCAISGMLNDWSGFDHDLAVGYIQKSQSYDGGIGLYPGAEGHGGSTYCAVAALKLLDRLDAIDVDRLARWCLRNQGKGFKGRPNKPEDTCYSFWLGATLKMIDHYHFTRAEENRDFNILCQSNLRGGFSKHPHGYPDILHSHYGVCGMSLMGFDGLRPLNVAYGMSEKVWPISKMNPPPATITNAITFRSTSSSTSATTTSTTSTTCTSNNPNISQTLPTNAGAVASKSALVPNNTQDETPEKNSVNV